MGFVQTDFVVDVTGLGFGSKATNNVAYVDLVSDLSQEDSSVSNPYFINVIDSNKPFDMGIEETSTGHYTLSLIFNKAFEKIKAGSTYRIGFGNGSLGDPEISVTIVFAYEFHQNEWNDGQQVLIDEDKTTIGGIPIGAPILSKTANRLWMAIFRTAQAAWHKARMNMRYYYYKDKYLNDILQFATTTHALPENSTSKISYNIYGQITKVLVTYTVDRIVRATYNYKSENMTIKRFCGGPDPTAVVDSSESEVIDNIVVDIVNKDEGTIRMLGTIKYIREPKEIIIANAPLYDSALSPISAINQLSHFRKYEVMAVTGYEVTTP